MSARPKRILVNSIYVAQAPGGNIELGVVHDGGVIRNDRVVIEANDVRDVIRALTLALEYGWVR